MPNRVLRGFRQYLARGGFFSLAVALEDSAHLEIIWGIGE